MFILDWDKVTVLNAAMILNVNPTNLTEEFDFIIDDCDNLHVVIKDLTGKTYQVKDWDFHVIQHKVKMKLESVLFRTIEQCDFRIIDGEIWIKADEDMVKFSEIN